MRPVYLCRVSQPFADPGTYNSQTDSHGRAGHHTGIDYGSFLGVGKGHKGAVPIDKRLVRSILPGEVVIDDYNETMGNWIGVYNHEHDLLVTYWHLDVRFNIPRWVQVFAPLGRVGNTGNSTAPHLHLQVNHGRDFDYSGHIHPRAALSVHTRREAEATYKRNPIHPEMR